MRLISPYSFLILIILFSFVSSADAEIQGRNIFTRTDVDLSTKMVGEIVYISLADFHKLIDAELKWNPIEAAATITAGERSIKVVMRSPYVVVDKEAYNIIYRAIFEDGSLYVPLITFTELCNKVLSGELIYYPDRNMLDFVPRIYNVLDIKGDEKINGYLITIFLTKPLNNEYHLTDEGWLNLTLLDGEIDTEKVSEYDLSPFVRSIKSYQFENSAQISFRLKNRKANFVITDQDSPPRITISINTDTDIVGLSGVPTWRKNNIELIVIDPGHGGKDPGAVGRKYGTMEKDIVLDISKRVRDYLIKKGLDVRMTREDDTFIPLGERTQFANRLGADLFVSVHANASERVEPRGCETFFLARAKNDEARAVAALENSAVRFEEKGASGYDNLSDLDFILMDIVQNEYLKESSDLAEMIQVEFSRHIRVPNRGIDQAGFYVLNRAYMPAVLVETAFISNMEEERLLRSQSFRQDAAEAIAKGILEFKRRYQLSER